MIEAQAQYRVEVDAFWGPMDLLLYLIKKAEVDIYDIPIASIADQYAAHVEALRLVDIGEAGEFLEMAATLLEIKSKMLLPREEVSFDEIEDPRSELVEQLLEYRRFKGLAVDLGHRESERAKRFARGRVETIETTPSEVPLEEVSLWDLVGAFANVLKQIGSDEPRRIVRDETPVRVYMAHLIGCLEEYKALSMGSLFEEKKSRMERIGLFLALLELIRLRQVRAEQTGDFAEINIVLA